MRTLRHLAANKRRWPDAYTNVVTELDPSFLEGVPREFETAIDDTKGRFYSHTTVYWLSHLDLN